MIPGKNGKFIDGPVDVVLHIVLALAYLGSLFVCVYLVVLKLI